MVVNNETSKVYQTVFISGELTFVRKPAHGHKIIVLPMYILAVAASGKSDCMVKVLRQKNSATYMIPISSGERISFITTVHLSIIFLLTLLDQVVPPSGNDEAPLLLALVLHING